MANDEGFGFLFPTKDREGNQPHVSGEATLNGKTVKVAGWTKTAKNSGTKYLSLKFQDYEISGEAVPEAADDEFPF